VAAAGEMSIPPLHPPGPRFGQTLIMLGVLIAAATIIAVFVT
jgi:hypothetical protein